MTYSEIISCIKRKEPIPSNDITGVQVFMLMYDNYLTFFRYGEKLFEIHIIPTDVAEAPFVIDDANCPNYLEAIHTLKCLVDASKIRTVYITLNDELFLIEFDPLID